MPEYDKRGKDIYGILDKDIVNIMTSSDVMIANSEFRQTYEKFIINLLSLRELRIKEKLQLCYYLIIQDI